MLVHQQRHAVQIRGQARWNGHVTAAGKGHVRTKLTHNLDRLHRAERDAHHPLDGLPGDVASHLASFDRHQAKTRRGHKLRLQTVVAAEKKDLSLVL